MKKKSIGKDYISIPFSLIKAQVITEEISRSPQTLSVMEQRKIWKCIGRIYFFNEVISYPVQLKGEEEKKNEFPINNT